MTNRYDDIINLPHHVSKTHPQMSMVSRAAQFSPFAALSGYEGQVQEAARWTGSKIELSETEKERLDDNLQIIAAHLPLRPIVSITYFVPDKRKDGGAYVTFTGTVKKIDTVEQIVVFYGGNGKFDGQMISIDTIAEIECGLLVRFSLDS